MEYNECVQCGFKCSKVCTVTRGTRKYDLHDFLERFLGNHEAIAWACTGCHACDAVCHASMKPYQLIQASMRSYLHAHENALTDYHVEYVDHGRIGVTGVFLDDLVLPAKAIGKHAFLLSFDKIITFPGCLVSARYPWLVHRLYQLLVLLGVDTKRIIVEDESCCGSFLQSIDTNEFNGNSQQLFKLLTKKNEKVLVLTACGSCTSTMRDEQARLVVANIPKKAAGVPASATILHYAELLAMPESLQILVPSASRLVSTKPGNMKENGNGKKRVYLQFPCQANPDRGGRERISDALLLLLGSMGYETTKLDHDLGCCGASLLDTHPDLAIEYGVRRMSNISGDSAAEVDTVAVACGNCHRIFVDFKLALQVECDCVEGVGMDVRFLLDMLMEIFVP
jgi:Fe-S oxidoreductase